MPADLPIPLTVEVDSTLEDRVAALRAAGRRVRQGRPTRMHGLRTLGRLLVYAALGFGITSLWNGFDIDIPGGGATLVLILVMVAGLLGHRQQTRVLRRAASAQVGAYTLAVSAAGLTTTHADGRSELSWSLVDGIERVGDVLFFHLRAFNVLSVPLRRLPEGMDGEAFVAAVERLSGLRVVSRPAAPHPVEASTADLWRDWVSNLAAGVLFFVAPRRAARRVRSSSLQLVLLLLTALLVDGVGEWLQVGGWGSQFNPAGVPVAALSLTLVLLVAWVTARVAGDDTRIVPGAVAFMSVIVVASVFLYGLQLLPDALQAGEILRLVYVLFALWAIVALVVALAAAQGLWAGQRAAAVLAVLLFYVMPVWWTSTLDLEDLWYPPYDAAEAARWQERQARVTREAVLYAQPALLDSTLARIPAGRPGVPEFFSLAVGGDGSQDVFLHEVIGADALLRDRFDARAHVVLVNNPDTIERLPMASMTALKRTLAAMGERMNRDEDVLLLFLTSHGAADFRFHLQLWPYTFEALTPETLTAALDEAGIRYRAIVVSACYSGGFVQRMAGPDTLVMSASRADRNSHGCAQGADWTFFGRALFAEALTRTWSLETAFDQAREAVAQREAKEGFKPSEPQIAVGDAVRPVLHAIEQRLEQGAPGATRALAPSAEQPHG